jgi:hypothetical protein
MLDKIAVFTKGGIVLWSESFTTLVGNPIDELVQTVLLEVRDKSPTISQIYDDLMFEPLIDASVWW